MESAARRLTMSDTPTLITVCAECLRASCWHGFFYCDKYKGAGIVQKSVSELRLLGRENESYWALEEHPMQTPKEETKPTGKRTIQQRLRQDWATVAMQKEAADLVDQLERLLEQEIDRTNAQIARAERAESEREQMRAATIEECAQIVETYGGPLLALEALATVKARIRALAPEPQAKDDQPNMDTERTLEYAKRMGLPTKFPL